MCHRDWIAASLSEIPNFRSDDAFLSARMKRSGRTLSPSHTLPDTAGHKLKTIDGREGRFFVEQAYPHRIVRWELLPDISAELTGTIREPYWKLHDNGHEKYLKDPGLKPTVE